MPTENMNIRVTFQNAAKQGVRRFTGDIKKIDKGVKGATKSMGGLYTQLLAIGGLLAGGALFGSAVKVFADFDDNMRAAGAVTSATADEMERMTQIAKEMGRETRYTASNSAEALRFLGMAGFEATDAIAALPGVLNLAAAGALDLGTAADIATNVLTSFGIEVENLGRVNDVLVKTFTSSNVNLIEFGEAFKMVGPVAKGVGSDFEDLSGAIGMLGNAGIKGTMAGTALKNAIDALLAPTGKEAALMKQLEARMGGVSLQIRDSEGDFIGFKRVIEQLELAGLRGDEALAAFGLRAGPAMVALLNQGSGAMDEMIQKLREAGGTSKEIADAMEAGIGGQLRKTISVIESFKIALGEAFGPEVIVVLTSFRNWLKQITDTIVKLRENGDLQGWGEGVVEVFGFMNTAIAKTYHALSAVTSLAMAAAGVLTGDIAFAKAAMEGFVKDVNNIFKEAEDPLAETGGKVVKAITQEMYDELDKAAQDNGPIGKGSKKVGNALVKNLVPEATMEAKLKSALIRLDALLQTESAQLEADYDQKIVNLDAYYDRRIEIIRERMEAERRILQDRLGDETDPSKKAALNAKIFALEQKLQTDTINLNASRLKDQQKFDKDLLKQQEDLNKQKLKADKALKDQQDRIKEEGVTTLDAQFQDEISKLQDRQNAEMEIIRNFHEAKLEALRENKAAEIEIEMATLEQKQALADQQLLQEKEKDQQAADQQLRLSEYRMQNMQQIAAGTAQVFTQLYQMMGSENKELFYIAKAAALAEATMNIAQGVTKAIAQGGVYGIATGALVAASGAIQIATIMSTGLAEGGEVPGNSPTSKSDNIGIMATAGEFMEPVASVQYYGKDIMEGLRTRSIPKGIFSGYATGGIIKAGQRNRFADGGLVKPPKVDEPAAGKPATEITMINVQDPTELDKYLASSSGQNAVLNVISSKSEAVKRIIR